MVDTKEPGSKPEPQLHPEFEPVHTLMLASHEAGFLMRIIRGFREDRVVNMQNSTACECPCCLSMDVVAARIAKRIYETIPAPRWRMKHNIEVDEDET